MERRRSGLLRDPFCESVLAAKPFLNERFTGAYRDLLASARAGGGLQILTGAPGSGKTTLLRYLLRGLFGREPTAAATTEDAAAAWPAFRARLERRAHDQRPVVLAMDDADGLPQGIIADISEFRSAAGSTLTVMLTGTPALIAKLADLGIASGDSLTVHAELVPLTEFEIGAYVSQALARAGHCGAALFPPEAIRRLAERSNGNLRRINEICREALSLAGKRELDTVTPEVVLEAADACAASTAAIEPPPLPPSKGMRASSAKEAMVPTDRTARSLGHAPATEPDSSRNDGLTQNRPSATAGATENGSDRIDGERSSRWPRSPDAPLDLGEAPVVPMSQRLLRKAALPDLPMRSYRSEGINQRRFRWGVAFAAGLLLAAGAAAVSWQVQEHGAARGQAETGIPTAKSSGSPSSRPEIDEAASVASRSPAEATSTSGGADSPTEATPSAPPQSAKRGPSESPTPETPAMSTQAEQPFRLDAGAPTADGGASASATSNTSIDVESLIARGDDLLRLNDVVSARLFYSRAAALGSPPAMTAMAATYDPLVLAASNVRGVRPEPREAIAWYQRAIDRGEAIAKRRLRALVQELRQASQIEPSAAAALLERAR